MHGSLPVPRREPTDNYRTSVQSEEQFALSNVARLLWPLKTAAHIAAAAGCSERAAVFYLACERQWSGDAIAAIVSEILRRHSMRNVKVVPKR
jgi:hypothetical protein